MLPSLAEFLEEIDCCYLKYKTITFLSLRKEVAVHLGRGKALFESSFTSQATHHNVFITLTAAFSAELNLCK